MAVLSIGNVQIEGIVSCVPSSIEAVKDCACLINEDAEKLISVTGIHQRRIAGPDVCTSDLCLAAAEKLITGLGWKKDEIDALIFVTQTPDYILPATSPILQHRLGLNTHCFTLDISLGCSGYVYGLITLGNLIANGGIRKGLLLVGDTVTKVCSPTDKSTYPLFGDAGSATALSYSASAAPIKAVMRSDGSGFRSIIVNNGGFRKPNGGQNALPSQTYGVSNEFYQLLLEGMDVFSFGITKAPEVTRELLHEGQISLEEVDYFIFHQANMMMNEKIRKKLQLPAEKVPYSLHKFGNTSCATIPLTITTEIKQPLIERTSKLVLCGFGVGLSWGAAYLETQGLKYLDCIEL